MARTVRGHRTRSARTAEAIEPDASRPDAPRPDAAGTARAPAFQAEILVDTAAAAADTGEPDFPQPAEPQPPAVTPEDSLQGYIDEASNERIKGWIRDRERPQSRIELELLDGDRPLVRVVANQHRSDLRDAGIGDGSYAFTIPLGADLLPGGRHVLRLCVAQTGVEIPGSPIIVERTAPTPSAGQAVFEPATRSPPEPMAPHLAAAPAVDLSAALGGTPFDLARGTFRLPTEGFAAGADAPFPARLSSPAEIGSAPDTFRPDTFRPDTFRPDNAAAPAAGLAWDAEAILQCNIDIADWTGIRGWVWSPQRPQQRIALELLDGDTLLATVLASEYREDLEEAGIGDGRHGFTLSFSETQLPYARHILHLRPVGSTVEVPTFPRVFTREDAGLDPTVQFILGNIVADAERAEKAEDLAPLVTSLVSFLDVAVSRYVDLAEDTTADAIELLNPADFAPQFQLLIKSLQWSYPPLHNELAEQPAISVVIPVFNKFELTYNCVKALVEQGAEQPFEIIIVDDCSRDETMLAALAFGRGIRLIRNAENSGFIRSCNRGFDAARGDYVVFLNNDTEVKARWLDELYETLQADPKIGIVGSKLLFPDGSLQECGGIVWRLGDGWNWGRDQPADDPRFSYMRDADYVSGAALMIKASLFAELGKFDEHFLPAYYEDTDLCFRARQAGYRVVVQPTSEVVHFEGASAGTSVTGTGMKRFQAINHRKFFMRWKDVLASHRFNGELPELEAERNVRQRALFIDDSVPQPDTDAGSNAALQHMLSLQRLGYKVSFIPADNMARINPYTADLQRRGIECLYHPFYFSVEDAVKRQRAPFEVVYLHRYSNASKYAGLMRQHFPEARILYNVADLHFLRAQREAELQNDAQLREKADQLRRLELGAMSFVDRVIVHSDAEAELLREIAPDIEVQVIPWTVPLHDIVVKDSEKPAIAFIGGYRHPPNVDAAKWAAQSLMPLLRKEVAGIELLLVGSNMPAEISSLAGKDIVPVGFVPALDSVFERVRLTIAPLRFGAGLKGKVLESLAAGIPCVMSTVAAEGVGLPEELQLLVADAPEVLVQRIALLCQDAAEYQRVVAACKAHVLAHYSSERVDALLRAACEAI
ncbi:MAG TPA: glycosyltransferase [Stellaceae bacterium]|nr:glycosyltransferase [Stellaceae bacterium]